MRIKLMNSRDQSKESDRFNFINNQILITITSKFFIYKRLKLRIKDKVDTLSSFFINSRVAFISKFIEI